MYVLLDNTLATVSELFCLHRLTSSDMTQMSDLIGFEGYLNTTTPFEVGEHRATWKNSRHYIDFHISNDYNDTCNYPRLYNETGLPVDTDVTSQLLGCYNSDFDQYGDIEAFGVHPDWQRQLAKFASVQDRLREWVPSVLDRIEKFSCITIAMLDIDGFRLDKATQSTVDAQGHFSNAMRTCAEQYGKKNFMVVGEITGGNTFGSIYIGRGRLSDQSMWPKDLKAAISMDNSTDDKYFIREDGHQALDAAAFHYSIYRSLTRFLGMDGNLEAGFDLPRNWVDAWNQIVMTNDLVNQNPDGPNGFDPRHMYGVTNQDVFRWPAITNGTERQLLGHFITTLHMPGSPLLLWGEEQAFYALDNTAKNYIFGRQAMSSAQAWQYHGCYAAGSAQYYQWPVDKANFSCHDDWNSLDHRDVSAPVRNILKTMFQMRDNYPVLNDGFFLQQLSNQTRYEVLAGSSGVPTEYGIWSVMRGRFSELQDLSGSGHGNQSVWLVYSNENQTKNFQFDCSNNDTMLNTTALLAPFDAGTTVKNLFYPFDELTLKSGARALGLEGSTKMSGCLDQLEMPKWGYAAYVPKAEWQGPGPMVTGFVPGHDARILANFSATGKGSVPIEIHFSMEMDCDAITKNISFESSTDDRSIPTVNQGSVKCGNVSDITPPDYIGAVPTTWKWAASLDGVAAGVHRLSISNISATSGDLGTGSTDNFMFRIGLADNPVVFPKTASYTSDLLRSQNRDGLFYLQPNAAGADLVRYSFDWGTTYSDWEPYSSQRMSLKKGSWSGASTQAWSGEHVILQYWSRLTGSSDHVQHTDLDPAQTPRRFPHIFWQGPYNQFGFDAGLDNAIKQDPDDHMWKINFMSEWPDYAQVNVWGINPDGQPDATGVFGDDDGDSVLDRSLPNSLAQTSINITLGPDSPFLAWQFVLDDSNYRFNLYPVGNRWWQLVLYLLLALVPIMTAALAVLIFIKSFYAVKFNKIGITEKGAALSAALRKLFKRNKPEEDTEMTIATQGAPAAMKSGDLFVGASLPAPPKEGVTQILRDQSRRRKVLIATMEYDIEDWGAKVKIGGLGVMAQLMGKNLMHQDLIWVVPKVGDIDYPEGELSDPMMVTIFGEEFEIDVQLHTLRNITFVLLDAPVFRKQMKAEPYPPRMDDLESGVYYSAWNQAISHAIERFKPDLYHINDYHGAVAPLHLLKKGQTIPVCLSLHNAEFQGLWPMRTQAETDEVCSVFNLPKSIVLKYGHFREVFNLLHAGASYLRVHQQGFGAVGVSKKYGKRSYARYPIFWGLHEIGQLPNPDPSDTEAWNGKLVSDPNVKVDPEFEAGRVDLKRQAQEWAGLNQDPKAELMVFVGRWSMQKGVDLIADVFPPILEKNPHVQLICIGPVIDLYGRFAALKLARMMALYPGRVFSKPEFTALPPYIFSGAEFALIPSRDEPFGLVAVEFGRKGALGIGARVGGLGQMPGWWYTVESTTTQHLLHQFRYAITEALASKTETRAKMRARSAKQRFPVAQWVEGLETLQQTSMKLHKKVSAKTAPEWVNRIQTWRKSPWGSGATTPKHRSHVSLTSRASRASSIMGRSRDTSPTWRHSHNSDSYVSSSKRSQSADRKRSEKGRGFKVSVQLGSHSLSLGFAVGPGHEEEDRKARQRGRSPWRRRMRQPDSRSSSEPPTDRSQPEEQHLPRGRMPPAFAPDDVPEPAHDSFPSHRRGDVHGEAHEAVPPLPRLSLGLPYNRSFVRDSTVSMASTTDDAASTYTVQPREVVISPQRAEQALIEQRERLEVDLDDVQSLRLPPWMRDQDGSPVPSEYATPRGRSPARARFSLGPPTADVTPRPASPGQGSGEDDSDAIRPAPAEDGTETPPNWPLPSLTPPRLPGPIEITRKSEPLIPPPLIPLNRELNRSHRDLSMLAVVGERTDYHLQKVDPFFTDSTGEYYGAFKGRLKDLNGKNSEGPLCIEDYLVKVEKKWFRKFKDAKLGIPQSRPASHWPNNDWRSGPPSPTNETMVSHTARCSEMDLFEKKEYDEQFNFGADYKPPTGIKRFMLRRIGDWPIYAFFLAFGQIIAANSYQITLLTGTVGQSAERLYVIATVYLITSVIWWGLFRWIKCVYVLSLPFFFYGLAFLFIGLAYFVPTVSGRGTMQTLGTVWYATASSSGSIFFATNFADEGGAPVSAWLYRACVIQGTQSAYVIALWYWGAELTKQTSAGLASNKDYSFGSVLDSPALTIVTVPIAVGLWAVGILLLKGLPSWYRQVPGAVPSFYSSIFRRRIILWFFAAVALQNYWLSAPYGRNWAFLWSSRHAPAWAIGLLVILFFGGVWALFLWLFSRLSKGHSWILPLFAIGLGAPRWAQMLWSCSGIGQYLPWAGGPVASALVGRTLWLWLGVLDSLQGVGLGMILLQTLTRIHIAFTLLAAQVLGSIFTILARATAPNNLGPGPVFPDFSVDIRGGLSSHWFWIGLLCQAIICVGFFLFFRKEQLTKP